MPPERAATAPKRRPHNQAGKLDPENYVALDCQPALRSGLTGRFDPEAFAGFVAGVADDHVAFLQSAHDFEAVAVVAADLDLSNVENVAGSDHRDLGAVVAHHHGVARNQQRRIGPGAGQLDLRVHAGQQRVVRIRHVHFDQQSAAGGIERLRAAGDGSGELAAREAGNSQRRGLTGADRIGVSLRRVGAPRAPGFKDRSVVVAWQLTTAREKTPCNPTTVVIDLLTLVRNDLCDFQS